MADGHDCELSTFLNHTTSIIFIITKPKAKNTASRVLTINGNLVLGTRLDKWCLHERVVLIENGLGRGFVKHGQNSV